MLASSKKRLTKELRIAEEDLAQSECKIKELVQQNLGCERNPFIVWLSFSTADVLTLMHFMVCMLQPSTAKSKVQSCGVPHSDANPLSLK